MSLSIRSSGNPPRERLVVPLAGAAPARTARVAFRPSSYTPFTSSAGRFTGGVAGAGIMYNLRRPAATPCSAWPGEGDEARGDEGDAKKACSLDGDEADDDHRSVEKGSAFTDGTGDGAKKGAALKDGGGDGAAGGEGKKPAIGLVILFVRWGKKLVCSLGWALLKSLVWFGLALLQGLITVSVFALVLYLCYNWYYDQAYLKCKNFVVLFLKDDDFKSQVQTAIEDIVSPAIENIVRSWLPYIRVGTVAVVCVLWYLRR